MVRLANEQHRTCITLFCTTTTWNCQILRFMIWWTWRPDTIFFLWTKIRPLEFNPRKNSSTFDSWTMWNNSEEKWQLNQLANLLYNTLRAEATFSRHELAAENVACSQGNFVSGILANRSLSHTVKPVLGGNPRHLFCCPLNRGVRLLKTMGRNVWHILCYSFA